MKMNFVHPCTRICQTVKSIVALLMLCGGMLMAATWQADEKPEKFSYKWEMDPGDVTRFVKQGSFPQSGIAGSFFYQGRYYPVYTLMIRNDPGQLAFQIKEKEEKNFFAPEILMDYGEIEEDAIDAFDIHSSLNEYVRIREIPGVGSLLEITPLIPGEDGQVRCLSRATIDLLPTTAASLAKADISGKPTPAFAKTTSLKTDLPEEFLALYITEPGVFQVSGQDLEDLGIDLRTVHPDNIKIYWWGEEIPCRVSSTYEREYETFQQHDVVQFCIPEMKNPYGDYLYNPFSDYDVIHMNWSEGNGLRYVQENSEITGNATFLPQENRIFRSTVHIERNMQYQTLARLHEQELSHKYEHEFYSPSISVGRSVSFPFKLWDPVTDSPYNVDFTLRMQGLTYSVDDEMDHQIYVTVNNRYLLEDDWDGQVPNISSNADMQFNHEYLHHGDNSINISVKGFEENPYMDDQVLFDWLKISYDRYMIAHDNRLRFSPQHGPGTYLFRVEGLTSASDVLILKDESSWIRGYYVTPEDTVGGEVLYSIYFEDECRGDEVYQIAGPGKEENFSYGIAAIDSIRHVNTLENDMYNTAEQGDYLIVTHKDFYEKTQELAEHKRSMGFTPVIYELERIYDEYNYSNESPYALKKFLTDAYHNWSSPPRYVLFIGDTKTENPLPVIKYQSAGSRGAVLAEPWFVDIDDDFVMEMALGRLPVSTEDELDSIITKIKVFDKRETPPQHQNRTALLTGPEATFKVQMEDYINTVSPDHVQTDRLYLYDSHVTGDFDAGLYATDTLVNFINDGIYCINYLGHGGGYTWDNYVLPYSAFEEFSFVRPFIVNSFTCFTNSFSNDNAIGEMLIRHPRAGVSVLSSTGYGWLNSNYYVYKKVTQFMYEDQMSHGDAMRHALTDYFFSTFGRNANFRDNVDGQIVYKYFRKSLYYQMCILGDPSATFPRPGIGSPFSLDPKSVSTGQNVEIQVTDPGINRGVLDIVGARGEERKYPVRQKIPLTFNDGQASFIMPEHHNITDGLAQLVYWDDNNNVYAGAERLAFDAPYISSLHYDPGQPGISDSAGVRIRMELDAEQNITQAYLRLYRDPVSNASYSSLALNETGSGVYETKHKIYYTSESSFYLAENDTASAVSYHNGNYFMPVLAVDGDSLTGDYYRLAPAVPSGKDISILDYSIEDGKSKLVLFNQADTAVHVDLHIRVPGMEKLSYRDTLLTMYDVDGQYESGTDKINTYYLDFLPAYGNGSLEIEIDPIEITDTDTSNNRLVMNVNNPWLLSQDGQFINTASDTVPLPGTTFLNIHPGTDNRLRQAIYINAYDRSYMLSGFGASQAVQNIMYINTPSEQIDFRVSLPGESLNNNKIVCYLSTEEDEFYTMPIESEDGTVYFPLRKKGYYLIAYPDENTAPDIEVNLNAREILTRGYVSERSDFSVILRDEYGVNPLPEFWNVLLDGEEIERDDISIIRDDNIQEMGLNFQLNMDVGEHTLQIVAHDLVGNRAESEEFQIVYTGESRLINYGNFPNPFTIKTTFIYELTEQFDDLRISIYTLSGRKIYTMSVQENAITDLPLQSIGYHEIPWYGKDEFGNTVANGVYFYVIEGKVDGKTIKEKGKVAKLR
ncbi:MAG: C25 family cysteine peptidase [Fidelibacterota bacterium]